MLELLMDDTGPFKLPFWTAIQLQHFFNSLPHLQHLGPYLKSLEEYCSDEDTIPRVLSKTYNLLNCPAAQPHLSFIYKRERDFWGIRLRLRFSLKSSICTKIQETNYKLLKRWYLTPHLLHKYYPATNYLCWRCQGDKRMLLHIFWSCPQLTHFWTNIYPSNHDTECSKDCTA